MGSSSWAIPVGVLSAIVVLAFVFVWWWFPRAWLHGTREEIRAVEEAGVGPDGEERAAARAANWERARFVIAKAKADAEARRRGDMV